MLQFTLFTQEVENFVLRYHHLTVTAASLCHTSLLRRGIHVPRQTKNAAEMQQQVCQKCTKLAQYMAPASRNRFHMKRSRQTLHMGSSCCSCCCTISFVSGDRLLSQFTTDYVCICHNLRKRKEKTTPFGVNLMRSQVLYRAAQAQLDSRCIVHLVMMSASCQT